MKELDYYKKQIPMLAVSKKTQEILHFLHQWSEAEHIYQLMMFHNMEVYDELEENPFLEKYWDVDLSPYFPDTFYEFSTEGGTGYFAFWLYPELQGEPPVVHISNYGEEVTLLAASLNDLVCKMIHNMGFNGGWHCEGVNGTPTEEDLEELYDEITDDYKEDISVEKAKELVQKNMRSFKENAEQVIELISEDQVISNIKKHPNPAIRHMQYQLKNNELLYLKHEIKDEKEFSQLLDYCKKSIKSEYEEIFTKEKVIATVKLGYPEYYKTKLFQDWIK